MTAGAAALSAMGTQPLFAASLSKPRKVWVLSDLHSGRVEGGKDGVEWFAAACKDIALWMSGHEHHTPYTPKHIARVGKTTYINVASMSHAYNTGSSESFLLEFEPGTKQIAARCRKHDTGQFIPEYEVAIPLKYPNELG